jgi:hypothetical protein
MALSFSAMASRQNADRERVRLARSIFSTNASSHQQPIMIWPADRTPGMSLV